MRLNLNFVLLFALWALYWLCMGLPMALVALLRELTLVTLTWASRIAKSMARDLDQTKEISRL